MNEKVTHMIQFLALLATGVILIVFAHQWVPPDVVFTSMIASTCSIVGARIVANGYQQNPPSPPPATP